MKKSKSIFRLHQFPFWEPKKFRACRYNQPKTILNHNFEVFELFTKSHKNTENIPCLIGMDLLHKLNIGITGLVLTHFEINDENTPFPPTAIDPHSEKDKANDSPFGTEQERAEMFATLKPFLDANANIDIASTYCNLPGAVVSLETTPGCIAFRKPYHLPLAFEPKVTEQIQTWLKEKVIELSTSHNGFNFNLLVVSKKDIKSGLYSFDKPRVVVNLRNLNSILEVTDTQSLPLISDRKVGRASLHFVIDIKSCFNSFLVDPADRHKLSFTDPFSNRQ